MSNYTVSSLFLITNDDSLQDKNATRESVITAINEMLLGSDIDCEVASEIPLELRYKNE